MSNGHYVRKLGRYERFLLWLANAAQVRADAISEREWNKRERKEYEETTGNKAVKGRPW